MEYSISPKIARYSSVTEDCAPSHLRLRLKVGLIYLKTDDLIHPVAVADLTHLRSLADFVALKLLLSCFAVTLLDVPFEERCLLFRQWKCSIMAFSDEVCKCDAETPVSC